MSKFSFCNFEDDYAISSVRIYTRKQALHVSQYSMQYERLYYEDPSHTGLFERGKHYEVYVGLCKHWSVGMGSYMCIQSSVDSLLCVYVREALLKMCKKAAPRDVCVLCTWSSVGMSVCVCVFVSIFTPLSNRQLLVYICMYMYVTTAKRLQLPKAVCTYQ